MSWVEEMFWLLTDEMVREMFLNLERVVNSLFSLRVG